MICSMAVVFRVNALSPGATDTPIFERLGLSEDKLKALKAFSAEQIPMKRLGRPEELAKAALFLAQGVVRILAHKALMIAPRSVVKGHGVATNLNQSALAPQFIAHLSQSIDVYRGPSKLINRDDDVPAIGRMDGRSSAV
jgi:NAD(P)-dependent dehydrogenase (short-subunit alcohol dehydrogenase family)